MRRRGNRSEETTAAAVTGWAVTALDEFERGPDAREGRVMIEIEGPAVLSEPWDTRLTRPWAQQSGRGKQR
jgi:hypothetical protein